MNTSDSDHIAGSGLTVDDLIRAVGGGLLTILESAPGAEIADITVAEPAAGIAGQQADLVLGVGIETPAHVIELIEAASGKQVAAVAVRRSVGNHQSVRAAAREHGVALVILAEQASWAHVIWLLRGVLDKSHALGDRSEGPIHDELFALADGCAALLDAPVTIEDPHSRVLAYSSTGAGKSQHHGVDPIRISTIVGRKVPAEVLASLRSRGVLRRLARARTPFFVPADGSFKARLIVPVRAGGERLGSIWAVLSEPPPAERMESLVQTASVVALHLLRMRSEATLASRAQAERLRATITGERAAGVETDWLPAGPWRVALLMAAGESDAVWQTGLWESACRRAGWRHPLITTADRQVLALVTAGENRSVGAPAAGSWGWLTEVARRLAEDHPGVQLAGGGVADQVTELDRSRVEAIEVARVTHVPPTAGTQPGTGNPALAVEDVWAAVTLDRATAGMRQAGRLLGPLQRLRDHDAVHDSDYLATLAAWLDHPGEPRAAAAQLHIHPNTLRYRLARLTGILGVSLSDPQVRLALRLQLRSVRDE